MRSNTSTPPSVAHARDERALPPGTGFLLTGAASLLLWGMIAGIAAIV